MRDLLTRALPLAAGLLLLGTAPISAAPAVCALKTSTAFEAALRRGVRQVEAQVRANQGGQAFAAAMALGTLVERCRTRTSDRGRGALRDLLRANEKVADLVAAHEAEALARRGVELATAITGSESAETAWGLNNLGVALNYLGQYGEAERLNRRALAIRERLYGPEDPNVALTLNNLAAILAALNRASEAVPLLRRVLAIWEKAYGPEHPLVATALSNLAWALKALGQAGQAEPLHRRALAIRERVLGPEHPEVARSLSDLAGLLRELGRAGEAEPLHRQALAIREKVYGPEDPVVAMSLEEVALALRDLAHARDAEPLYRRALAIREKIFGPEHPLVAMSLSNLASVLQDLGRTGEAEALYRHALAIDEKVYGPEHPAVATDLNNFAGALGSLGRGDDAEPLFRRALAIYEKVYGPEDPLVAASLNNLASVLQDLGRLGEAVPLYRRALAIYEKVYGPEHRDVATGLNNLASVLRGLGRHEETEPLLRRALAIREKVFGPEHPLVATMLSNLAEILSTLSRPSEAEPLMKRALAILEKIGPGSEQDQRLALQLTSQFIPQSAFGAEGAQAWRSDGALRAMQLVAQTSAATALVQMSARAAIRDPKAAEHARHLEQARRERDGLYRAMDMAYARNDSARIAALRDRLPELDKQIQSLEAQLQAEAPDYAELAAPKPLGTQEAAALLAPDEALLVFTLTEPNSALLLVTREGPVPVLLPNTARIRDLVSAVLNGVAVGRVRRRGPIQGFDLEAAHELYRMLLGPVEGIVATKRHLILVPSGALTGLPFQLLVTRAPEPGTRYRDAAWLIRDHAVSVLPSVSSLRALRQTMARRDPAPLPFVGFGDPLIGDTHAQIACAGPGTQVAMATTGRSPPSAAEAPVSGTTADGIAIADVDWLRAQPRLPGTRCELEALARTQGQGSATYLGPNATEAKVKTLSASGALMGYRVVAFATHGLLPRQARGSSEAGLILTPPEQGSVEDDGLLTTSEVAGLRLNADWVLLSACNTAAGEDPGSEALSGLARAFFFAGARSVLVSHWPVDDRAAVELTTRALGEMGRDPGIGRAEALRRAELWFLSSEGPEAFTDPRYWAPFSLVGEGGRAGASRH